jgi:environmental stress-induced protein Ves
MRLLPAASARRVPWKNGLGSTLELATDADAPGGAWTWRLSAAEMPARARFSEFRGVDRFIACLSGPGLTLERGGARALVPREGEALAFAGEERATGEPLGPGVRDVNLMLRRDRWRGRMTIVRAASLELDAPLVLVHAAENSAVVRGAGSVCALAAGRVLIASGRVAVAAGGVAVACELHPVPAPERP